MRRGILLAGGSGSRLAPITKVLNKHLLPVHNKPVIYYSLSVLMLAGMREILVISSAKSLPLFEELLGDGAHLGLSFSYAAQDEPRGIAESLLIARDFLAGGPSALMLGDNLIFGDGLVRQLRAASSRTEGATIFAYPVLDPSAFGVVELDEAGKPVSLREKPKRPRSNLAVPGLYFYDGEAPEIAASCTPSKRGELEITDVNRAYLDRGRLSVTLFGRGYAWLDTGTPEALNEAAEFVRTLEERQGLMIGSPEEVAWRNGWIGSEALLRLGEEAGATRYGEYLRHLGSAGRADQVGIHLPDRFPDAECDEEEG
jgi:glucose-1-phosphate thymidylyltransferase